MTNFDCPNKQTRTPIGTRMLPHVNMDVPDHQRRRRPYNPCGRVRKLKEKTTLEPHDCSKMVRKELSPIISISALQGSHRNDVCSDRSARRSDVRRSDPAEGTRGTLSPSEGCQQQGCLVRLF